MAQSFAKLPMKGALVLQRHALRADTCPPCPARQWIIHFTKGTTMNSNAPASTTATQDATTVGIGGQTSGQQGATPSHESQTETGGNGGPGLTRNQSGPYVNAPDGTEGDEPPITDGSAAPQPEAPSTVPLDTAATHTNPGAQDTRPGQAGPKVTGMGAPETGGNQNAGDLPPFTR
jgi:hypothetical protein